MATYNLAQLADRMRMQSVEWDIKRFDECAGSGSGHDLQSELAKPKWSATVTLARTPNGASRQIKALLRKLNGMQDAFMLADLAALYPLQDPDGTILGANVPMVSSVSGAVSLAIKGLPGGYRITAGDRGQIVYGAAPERNFYFEFSDDAVASGGGVTPQIAVFPALPTSVVANLAINLKRPACKMKLLGGAFDPGTATRVLTEGMSFRTIEAR